MIKLREIIKEILAKKKVIIAVAISVALISTLYYFNKAFQYKSEVSFFIDDSETDKSNLDEVIPDNSANVNRVYHLIKSTEMCDYLIDKFNLNSHFKIGKNSPLQYENLTALLNENISVSQMINNGMLIVVKDNDKVMAAKLANEMFKKLDDMIKEYAIEKLERKIKIYDQVLNDTKKQAQEQTTELKKLIDDCKVLLVNGSKLKSENNLIFDLNMKLALLSSQLSGINGDLLKSIRIHEISMAGMKKENLLNLKLIRKAVLDVTSSPLRHNIFNIIGFSILAALITMVLIILLYVEVIQDKTETQLKFKVRKYTIEN